MIKKKILYQNITFIIDFVPAVQFSWKLHPILIAVLTFYKATKSRFCPSSSWQCSIFSLPLDYSSARTRSHSPTDSSHNLWGSTSSDSRLSVHRLHACFSTLTFPFPPHFLPRVSSSLLESWVSRGATSYTHWIHSCPDGSVDPEYELKQYDQTRNSLPHPSKQRAWTHLRFYQSSNLDLYNVYLRPLFPFRRRMASSRFICLTSKTSITFNATFSSWMTKAPMTSTNNWAARSFASRESAPLLSRNRRSSDIIKWLKPSE